MPKIEDYYHQQLNARVASRVDELQTWDLKKSQENLKIVRRHSLVPIIRSKNKKNGNSARRLNKISYLIFHKSPTFLDFVSWSQHILWKIVAHTHNITGVGY